MTTETKSVFPFIFSKNTETRESNLHQAEMRAETADSNFKALKKFKQHVMTEEYLGYGMPYPNEPAQFLTKPEFTWLTNLQDSKVEKSISSLNLRRRSKNLFDQVTAIRETYDRIANLKELAAEEGMKISASSEKDLRLFLASIEYVHRPYIALLDNSNLRAVWKNADREQIGLQFRGHGSVQYVLFALRSSDRFMAQATGKDKLVYVRRLIEVQGLGRLMSS